MEEKCYVCGIESVHEYCDSCGKTVCQSCFSMEESGTCQDCYDEGRSFYNSDGSAKSPEELESRFPVDEPTEENEEYLQHLKSDVKVNLGSTEIGMSHDDDGIVYLSSYGKYNECLSLDNLSIEEAERFVHLMQSQIDAAKLKLTK